MSVFVKFRNALVLLALAPLLYSCASYHTRIQQFHAYMDQGDYESAIKSLDKNRFMKKPRNEFLYLAEKGRAAHLAGMYEESNRLLNEADQIAEDPYKSIGEKLKGTVLNPMKQTYTGEPFERFMLHYYKALNYFYLGNIEEAVVEARRITLATYDQQDITKDKDNRYSKDAFSHILQGLIYEKSSDINNAFIAYRNAAETYLNAPGKKWYGVPIPEQLQMDLLRTAGMLGFTNELQHFERLFNASYEPPAYAQNGGELILFVETGRAPVKEEESLGFALVKGEGGAFFFTDPSGNYHIPFNASQYGNSGSIGDLRTFRIALPYYRTVSGPGLPGTILVNGSQVQLELVENLNEIALKTMQERRLKDITNALTRLAVKKLAEAGARGATKAIVKNNSKEEDEEKKEKKAENAADAAGLILQAFSLATERADTRNWQSLPAYIYYTRIPLNAGENIIEIKPSHGYGTSQVIKVHSNGNMIFRNIVF